MNITYDPTRPLKLPSLPPPPLPPSSYLEEHWVLGLVLAFVPEGAGHLRLEILSRWPKYHGDEIVYLGKLLQEIEDYLGELVIDGLHNHFLLSPMVTGRPRSVPGGRMWQSQPDTSNTATAPQGE